MQHVEKTLKLTNSFVVLAFFAFVGAIVTLAFPIRMHLVEYETTVQTVLAERAGEALSIAVSRAVEREWDSLVAVSNSLDTGSVDRMQSLMDAVAEASSAVAWAGVATPGGTIVAGSYGQRVGEDVSERRWHREGLRGGSAGSAYSSQTSPITGAAHGLINMSAPVLSATGSPEAVLMYSIEISWMSDYIAETAEALDVDFFIRDQQGQAIAESRQRVDDPMSPELSSLLDGGHKVARLISPQDGTPHVVAIFPKLIDADMPDFNWRLAVRVPAMSSNSSLRDFLDAVRVNVLILLTVSVIIVIVYSAGVLRPIERLVQNGLRIANGEDVYPLEDYSSRESTGLTKLIATLDQELKKRM